MLLSNTLSAGPRQEGFAPTIHGWMFDLSTGLIRELDLPLEDWEREGLL